MKKLIKILVIFLLPLSIKAQNIEANYTIDPHGNVVVSEVVENLPLNQKELYYAAHKYLEDAYKDTKYKIVFESDDHNSVVGEGILLSFHEANIFPHSYFLDAPIQLRIDAKDGRARICASLSYYTGKRSNINETIDIHDRISDFVPINKDKHEHKKLYSKAFPILLGKVNKIIGEVKEHLQKTTPATLIEGEW